MVSVLRCGARRFASTLANDSYDVAIIGGGHNALVAANYLARAGQRVCVVEKRPIIGGAAVTEELHPGFKYSRASYVYSLFRPHIAADLGLTQRGLKLLRRLPSSFSPQRDAGAPSLALGGGDAFDAANIAQFSSRDVVAWGAYNAELERYARFARYVLDAIPPDAGALMAPLTRGEAAEEDANGGGDHRPNVSWLERLHSLDSAARLGVRALQDLGPSIPQFLSFLTSPASRTLDKYFESPLLKATLATDAVIGAFVGPSTPSSGYVLLHHCMTGAWFNVVGGMGSVSQALAHAAREKGVDILTGQGVSRIRVSDSSAVEGVELESGEFVRAKTVFSSVAPTTTFVGAPSRAGFSGNPLLQEASELLPSSVYSSLKATDNRSAVMKINCAIDRLPQFKCRLPGHDRAMVNLLEQHRRGIKPVPGEVESTASTASDPAHLHLRGTIHFEDSMGVIERAFSDATNAARPNEASSRPLVELTIPSLLDPSIAPEGKHVALLFVQYAPYQHADGWTSPTPQAARETFADKVFEVIDQYAPGFSSSVLHRDILAPPDLEAIFGLPGGNIFHTAMGLDQLFWSRPVSGLGSYKVPWVKGLYLCGAGTHPGGGVMGASGHNAAVQYLMKERGWTKRALAGKGVTSSPWIIGH